jgi:hypothetical protein
MILPGHVVGKFSFEQEDKTLPATLQAYYPSRLPSSRAAGAYPLAMTLDAANFGRYGKSP